MGNLKFEFFVNKEKKTVACVATDEDNLANREILNILHRHTIEEIGILTNWGHKEFVGVAKCHPEDEFDEEIGKRIAKLKSLMKFNHYKEMLIYSVIPNTEDVTEHLYKAAWYAHQKQEEQWNEILSYIGQKGQEDSTSRQFGDF